MANSSWWRRLLKRRGERSVRQQPTERRPLREFVYLDEVSLTSLLVSQKDTIPEQVTSGRLTSDEAELHSRASVGVAATKIESTARYQTTNSNSVESSRKAVVQTLFNEFRDDHELQLILEDNGDPPEPIVVDDDGRPIAIPGWASDSIQRGGLIEVTVTLDVDPVFKLGTMVSEFSAMAADYPEMAGQAGSEMLRAATPVNKVLDRLLAGLIPLRASAVNLSAITVDKSEYIVRTADITELDLPRRPVEIVGVTEHIGYWKDIRRVLFSSGEFKILCRVSRSGLHRTWTPVKVAHLFEDVAPTLVDQIDAASRMGSAGATTAIVRDHRLSLLRALTKYVELVAERQSSELQRPTPDELMSVAAAVGADASLTAQRDAFRAVRDQLEHFNPELELDASTDLELRRSAREAAGLSTLPSLQASRGSSDGESPMQVADARREDARLIDVEVVAIYW